MCWEEVKESSLLKRVYMKKKNDKKVLHLTKWMLRITTPLLLLLMFNNLFLSLLVQSHNCGHWLRQPQDKLVLMFWLSMRLYTKKTKKIY